MTEIPKQQEWPRTMMPGAPQQSSNDVKADTTQPDNLDAQPIHHHIDERSHEVRAYLLKQFIYREGESGDLAFILQEGNVDLIKKGKDGNILVDHLKPGALFGEFSMIDNGNRVVSAQAASDSVRVIVISRKLFQQKLDNADPFLRALLQVLTSNVRTLLGKIS